MKGMALMHAQQMSAISFGNDKVQDYRPNV